MATSGISAIPKVFGVDENRVPRDGELFLLPDFIPPERQTALFECLLLELFWQEEVVTVVGRRVPVPRMVCWHGDPDAAYRYSGLNHQPQPWTETLLHLKSAVEQTCGHPFNGVLGNLYRNGLDSMGWHADNERSLGKNPYIASLSLGASRLFRLRHDDTGETVEMALDSGSLLLMGGSLQHHWKHCLPKSRKVKKPRINLTFRRIFPPGR